MSDFLTDHDADITDEDALRGMIAASSAAWIARDAEALTTSGSSLHGYGYRVRDARTPDPDAHRAALSVALASYDYFRIVDHDVNVRIDGDTAIVWGSFTEEFQNSGLPPEVVRVRFSNTAVKRNGEWRFIWSHRDAQDFNDDGRYVPCPVEQ